MKSDDLVRRLRNASDAGTDNVSGTCRSCFFLKKLEAACKLMREAADEIQNLTKEERIERK